MAIAASKLLKTHNAVINLKKNCFKLPLSQELLNMIKYTNCWPLPSVAAAFPPATVIIPASVEISEKTP